jgi:hypothetical protein
MGIWVHPYTVTLVQVGVDFRKIGVWLSLSDVVRSWLRLQTPVDCIPHPYHMNIKCFSTLICCGWEEWVHPHTVTPAQVGVDFWIIAIWLSPSDVVMSWLRLQTPVDCISHQ